MCKLNLKLTAGPFGIVIEEQQMSCAKFEPTVGIRVAISDSDWAKMISKLSVNLNMKEECLSGGRKCF